MEVPKFKKNHKENIKFLNPFLMSSLEEPSFVATTRLKQRLPTQIVTSLTHSTYKMCAKLKEEGL